MRKVVEETGVLVSKFFGVGQFTIPGNFHEGFKKSLELGEPLFAMAEIAGMEKIHELAIGLASAKGSLGKTEEDFTGIL